MLMVCAKITENVWITGSTMYVNARRDIAAEIANKVTLNVNICTSFLPQYLAK